MKKLFEPIKLRENSRERVLRELISYNDIKDENNNMSKNFSEDSDSKSLRVLKPLKKKKTSIIMEVLAGAAVIAMIAGVISVSINKSGNITQPSKNVNSQEAAGKDTNENSNQNNVLQGALPVDTPMIEFISSETLGVSIAFNREYLKEYMIDDDGSITLYQSDAGTETGFNWNNIIIRGSLLSYEEEIYNWTNDMYDHYYGTLQDIKEVTLGELSFDYMPNNIDIYSHDILSTGIKATRFSFSYDLHSNPDSELEGINALECRDIYVIDSSPYNSGYGAYIINVAYQAFYDNNNNIEKYSTAPILIYETLDSFAFTTYTKKTYYLLANGTYTDENSQAGIKDIVNFSINYADNTTGDGYEDRYDSFYSLLTSPVADKADDFLKVILPIGRLYDASGTRDINLSADFQSTFDNSVAIDLYYPYPSDSDEASTIIYPLYGVLHTTFKTDTNYTDVPNNDEKNTVSPNDSGVSHDSSVTSKYFEIYTAGDKMIYIGDKYVTIYGISESFAANKDPDFIYDYTIYVPIEQIFDENGNSVSSIISDIVETDPPLTMTVYYNGMEFETFPVQIYANEVVIHGLETTNIYN